MDTLQYGRKVSVIIGEASGDALDVSELRVTFQIKRSDQQTPNSATVKIYNVSQQTRDRIEKEFTRVVIQGGYEGNFGIIFDGNVTKVRRARENETDSYLEVSAADGDVAYNHAVVNQTLNAGSTSADHVQAASTAMAKHGVKPGYTPKLEEKPLPRGKVMFGMARDFMRAIAKTTETVWSIQDGKLIMVPETAYVPDEIPVVTAQTGLIGHPEQTQNGIKLRMLLNPAMRIGRLIQLDNASVERISTGQQGKQKDGTPKQATLQDDGYYYVMLVEHTGSTRDTDYYSDVTCLAADVTVLQDFYKAKGSKAPEPGKAPVNNK